MQYVLKYILLTFDKAKLYPNFAYWETYSTIKILRC